MICLKRMPSKVNLVLRYLQAQYHSCLASSVAFCGDPESAHGKHFSAVMGEAMTLLTVFMEFLPDQFMACQSIHMLDGTTRMPPQAFEKLKVHQALHFLSFCRQAIAHAAWHPSPGDGRVRMTFPARVVQLEL